MQTDFADRLARDATAAGLSHIVVVQDLDQPVERVGRVLSGQETGWLGDPIDGTDAPAGTRRYLADIGLQLGAGSPGILRKAAFVDLGSPRRVGAGFEAQIGWRAATLAPLFPVFAGRLAAAEGELRIEGWYAPPGGVIGRVADRMLLNLAARATARWLLATLVDAVAGLEQERR